VEREQALADCIAAIRRRRRRQNVGRLTDQLRAAEARGDDAAADAVKRQLMSLMDAEHAEKAPT
jgi:hypothetical protein